MIRHKWAIAVVAATFCVSGCGPSLSSVKGVVTLDGNPVEGATVSFVSEDGKQNFSGFTDANGNFTLTSNDQKQGAAPGTYKVTVVKIPAMKAGGPIDPGSPEYVKEMQREQKEFAGKSAQPKTPMPGGKMPIMPGAPPQGPTSAAPKSVLPEAYASASTTPISVKVPPDSQPVKIELKSKP